MRSVCGKAACRINGIKPVMIFPAVSTQTAKRIKNISEDETDEESNCSSNDSETTDSNGCSQIAESDDDDDDNGSPLTSVDPKEIAISCARRTWKMISPPVKEEDIIGKWFGVVYRTEKFAPALYVAKALKRFLADENGIVECLGVFNGKSLLRKHSYGNSKALASRYRDVLSSRYNLWSNESFTATKRLTSI